MGVFRMNHFLHCCMAGSWGSPYIVYQISSFKSRPKGNKWSCRFEHTNLDRFLESKVVSETRLLRRKNNKSQDAQVTAYNSQHARGGTQWLRRLARGCSWVVSMAAFADLDIRAGSDLKALRGLVETAAHRESVIFAPEPCPRYPSYHPVFSVVSLGAISVSRGVRLISIEAEDACLPCRPDPRCGRLTGSWRSCCCLCLPRLSLRGREQRPERPRDWHGACGVMDGRNWDWT